MNTISYFPVQNAKGHATKTFPSSIHQCFKYEAFEDFIVRQHTRTKENKM